ncbi:MAG: shikimate kinase [Algicola sp.]|nr:shikimate kinase [Algicola sp.]
MTLFLVGYMGSGKSVIGKIISEVLNYDYVDFDTYIETKEQATVSSLFKHKGEIYFRKAEQTYLQDILKMDRTVVSLGGGTPCYGDTMDCILASHQATTVYLKASIKTLTDRLFDERANRPLIAHLVTKGLI